MSTQKDITVRELNERLYDILMGAIEPDLTLAMIPQLDEIYKHETTEEHAERMQRYATAMQEFQKRSQLFTDDVKAAFTKIKNRGVALAKKSSTAHEQKNMDSLSQSLEQS